MTTTVIEIKAMGTTTTNSEFITRKEAAEQLRCSTRTIDRMIEDGEFRSKKVRGKRLIYRVSFEAYIETSC